MSSEISERTTDRRRRHSEEETERERKKEGKRESRTGPDESTETARETLHSRRSNPTHSSITGLVVRTGESSDRERRKAREESEGSEDWE